ncbi:hypothetical protein OG948_58690 (plasmid) [Embleya sp. NBC_00888]|uniref:hypothetical protein n=1 Tax=Embleya sp. NBC_00888 TaxID=2975960 RepID=UPI002F90C89F|nr:hypothetical protein OG948_58690 [Embleya sp. NBC_00888]
MSVDPSDPSTFEEDPHVVEIDVEVPEADAAERHAGLTPRRDDRLTGFDPAAAGAADAADAAEQARVVEPDEDDYR